MEVNNDPRKPPMRWVRPCGLRCVREHLHAHCGNSGKGWGMTEILIGLLIVSNIATAVFAYYVNAFNKVTMKRFDNHFEFIMEHWNVLIEHRKLIGELQAKARKPKEDDADWWKGEQE